MDRFFFKNLSVVSEEFLLDDPVEFRHLSKVLRLKEGEMVEITDGAGLCVIGNIVGLSRGHAKIKVVEKKVLPKPRGPYVVLACALPKKAKFEDIIDQCTQLGADEIIPMVTERTEVDVRKRDLLGKMERYQRIILTAVKQSKRSWMPILHLPMTFKDALRSTSEKTGKLFIPWLQGERCVLKDALATVQRTGSVAFFIGPEGDFTADEVELACSQGARTVSLGDNVLRVDTAAALVVGAAKTF